MRFGEQSREIWPVMNFNGSRLLSSVVLGIEPFIARGGGVAAAGLYCLCHNEIYLIPPQGSALFS